MTDETNFNADPALKLILIRLAENAERTATVCERLAGNVQALLSLFERLDARLTAVEAKPPRNGAPLD